MAHPQHAVPVIDSRGEIRPVMRAPGIGRWSWAVYDFSNTIFSMNVATRYFSVWMVSELGSTDLIYSMATGVASILMVVAIPVLGALSDARRRRKPWVVGFTIVSCIACAAIGLLGQLTLPISGAETIGGTTLPASWHPTIAPFGWVLVGFVIANNAYQAARPSSNALL